MSAQRVTAADIAQAASLLAGVIEPTPMQRSRALSRRSGVEVFLKCENLQRAGSFKIRGAYTRMSRLTEAERAAGVVAASAGNHAQGVALAANLLGIPARVYMPVGAALPKLAATRAYGATVELVGHTLDEAIAVAREYAAATGATFISPFDHVDIVAGQGTVGLEILAQCPDVRTVVVATGGGGLIAGIATAVKAHRPQVRVIGVQAEQAAAYPLSLAAGRPVPVDRMATMADGIAVGCPGEVPFDLVARFVDAVETVSEEAMSQTLVFLLERAKLVVEPAGAAAAAWLLQEGHYVEGPAVAVLSGGNIDPLLLLRIVRHGLTSGGRYLEVSVRVPDLPGSLATLLADLAAAEANVVEVAHTRTTAALRVDEVEIAVQLETKGPEHRERVLRALRDKGYRLVFGA
ncbi:MAG: threonine ammonia-lyase [Dermatophilaceae bacterium]